MVLSKIHIFILALITSHAIMARSSLPELKTKQAVNNLRFISKDGKFTYYQRRSGSLLISTNYKVKEVIKGKVGTQYSLISSKSRKQIIVVQDESFHTFYGYRKLQNIYTIPMGGDTARPIGKGVAPQLHLNDEWISYYDPHTKVIHFQKVESESLFFRVRLNNVLNPYFVPERIMATDNFVYITDLNKDGYPGVIEFERNAKRSKAVFKAASASQKIEICLNGDNIFLGSFGINDSNRGSAIFKLPRLRPNFKSANPIYKSELNDLGNIVCDVDDKSLFFIKNLTKSKSKTVFEANELNLETKKEKVLSDVQFAVQILNMDGSLLLPYRGKYYVLKGEDNHSKSDSLDSTKDNSKK